MDDHRRVTAQNCFKGEKDVKKYTEEEILTLSECVLKTMNGISDAKKLMVGADLIAAANKEIQALKLLNDKILAEI